ncbi:MAG: MCE family protein [Spirochaetaceae bacterium]|nr:MAG: MCE family protein [Spirochaetaceae bacterium]
MSRAAKIGLFVAVVTLGGIAYITMSGDGFSENNTYRLEVVMEDASGLVVNSQVFLAGVPVGTIRSITLDGRQARVELAISEDVEIFDDATVFKQASSLLGTSVIAIDPGRSGGTALSSGGRIERVSVRGDFSETLTAAEDAGHEIRELVAELRRQHVQLLASSLEGIDRIIARVDARSQNDLEQVSRILADVAITVERIALLVDSRDEDVQESILAMRRSIDEVETATVSLRRSMQDVEDMTGTMRRGEGNIGRVVYEDELYERVVSVARSTEALIEQVRGLGVQVGFESAYLTEREATQSAFSLRLLPRSRQGYYEIGVVDTPEGVSRRRTITEAESVGGGPTTTTVTDETIVTDDVRFNAQIARHFGPVTMRGGLIESSGGFGLDLRPVSQLMLSGELFAFGGDDEPNLRATGTLFPFYNPDGDLPWYWLYVTGGMTNILNPDSREFFLGAGVRFTDEDIRGLVGLIPFGN